MEKMNDRENIQKQALDKIIENEFSGIFVLSPRSGKTKIAIDAMKLSKFENIFILVPRTIIKNSWYEELNKWNYNFNKKNILCNASAKKLPNNIDLLIIDEVHTLSVNQIYQIRKANPKKIIGLTGTIQFDTINTLSLTLGLNVKYNYSIDKAVKEKVIADFEINLIGVDLDNTRQSIVSGTKKKPELKTELEHYTYLTNQFEKFKYLCNNGEYHLKNIKDYYMRTRKDFINTSKTKIEFSKKITNKLNRCLIFCSRQSIADELSLHSFHGNNVKKDNLNKFNEELINKLSVVDKVDMGVTINNLKHIVVQQLNSNPDSSIQKFLRACNYEDGKKAYIYVLYYRNTVDELWVKNALKNINKDKIQAYELK